MNDFESTPSEPAVEHALRSAEKSKAHSQLESRAAKATQRIYGKISPQGIKETLEIGGKSIIGLAGLCYVLGLVVVTIHLRRYGLNSLSLSQLYYATAGVWVLLPALVMMSLVALAKFIINTQDWKAKQGEPKWPKVFAVASSLWVFSFGFYVGATYLVKQILGIQLTVFSLKGVVKWLLIPLLGALAFWSLAVFIYGWIFKPRDLTDSGADESADDQNRAAKLEVTGIWVFAIFQVFLIALYISLFATFTYPEIPWATGGGRPSQVQLVVATEAKTYFENVGIKFSGGQNRTDSMQLLLATDKEYIVINSEGKAVGIPADSVKSMIYER